ncbi:UDP-N-acetylmuramoyl-tripeptide--D-alanyl-D-alanine ligase [Candidatus Caldatribacterium saccharofermentans]|uniref:UDP-N-acetylmuramoyl-tripeptide--D-alanyl-D- alanine ligase n=1 Tax=Candidatus Caldatribacterium saccharofermentans TaxID=1454753 RepID=UPI003D06E665
MWFTLEEIRGVTQAEVLRVLGTSFEGVAIDSRKCQKEQLFVALRGKRVDGHAFIGDALKRGASGVLVERWEGDAETTVFVVPSTEEALLALGKHASSRLRGVRIGITGTVGKTTCKHLFAHCLGQRFSVALTPQSFNTVVGVSSSFANFDEHVAFVVVEAGISEKGEMEVLSGLIRPEVAVFTAFGEGHLEGLGSVLEVVEEKLKLLGEKTQRVYLNVDRGIPEERRVRDRVPQAEVFSFGASQRARLRLVSFELDVSHLLSRFTVAWEGTSLSFEAPILAPEVAVVSLPAIHFALEMGVPFEELRESLRTFRELPGRGGFFRWGNGVVIDDTYNANPPSMQKAVHLLSRFAQEGYSTYLVLGDMLELGDFAEEAHREILERIQASPIRQVLLFGPHFVGIAQKEFAREVERGRFVVLASFEEGRAFLESLAIAQEQWVVLLKGSRGMELEAMMPEEWRSAPGD